MELLYDKDICMSVQNKHASIQKYDTGIVAYVRRMQEWELPNINNVEVWLSKSIELDTEIFL